MAGESLAQRSARARRILVQLQRLYPDARLALDFRSPLELLLALILAAQCTDEKVNQVTRSLFARYRSPEDFARVSQPALEAEIRPTGFYRNKAKAIQACCRALVTRHGGSVPDDLEHLLSLPGVGRKTANILLANAFGRPAIGVDTHVMRLAQRLGLTRHTDPDRIEGDLSRIVQRTDWVRLCHLLQFHGRRVCTARSPACSGCAITSLCPYPGNTGKRARASSRAQRRQGT